MGWYETPVFNTGDPLVCRTIALRPSLWAVAVHQLELLGYFAAWEQVDPSAATVADVIAEINKALDASVISAGACHMIGEIIELAIATTPAWLLRCDGATYANVDYPDLAAVIHPGYVVDADHFKVPDRNQRHGVDGYYPATQGGEQSHTQTIAEMPSHHHTDNEPAAELSSVLGDITGVGIGSAANVTGDTGGGNAFNVLDPYEGTQFYIIAKFPSA